MTSVFPRMYISSDPAAGPVTSIGVVASMRRLCSSLSANFQAPPSFFTRKIEPPVTAFSVLICSGVFLVS
jgi:hypothetical protein